MSEIEELKMVFSDNLKYYLSELNLTQVDLTNYMQVSSSTVSDWCNGKKLPRMDKIQKICEWMRITRDDLLESRELMLTRESLTSREKYVLQMFDRLNQDGQQKATEYIEDLAGNDKYKKDNASFEETNIA